MEWTNKCIPPTFDDIKFESYSKIFGIACRVDFPNGYTASIVRGPYTYGGDRGLYEIACIYNGEIVYDTPFSGDVRGYLTKDDVTTGLRDIFNLPIRTKE